MSSPTKDEMLDRLRRFMTSNPKAKVKARGKAKARFDCAIGDEVAWPKRPVRRRVARRRVVRRRSLKKPNLDQNLDERRVAREKWMKREVESAREFSFTNSLLRKDLEQTRAYLKDAKEEIMVLREKLFLVERVAHGRIDRIEELERENSELEAEVIAAKVIREGKLRGVGKYDHYHDHDHDHEGKHDTIQLEQKDYKTTQDAQESILQRFTRYFTLK